MLPRSQIHEMDSADSCLSFVERDCSSYPPLWAVVRTNIGDQWLKTTLERCNNAPETLAVGGEGEHRLTAARITTISGALVNNQGLKEFAAKAPADKLQALVSLLEYPAPNLRCLYLRNLTASVPVILPNHFPAKQRHGWRV